MPRNWNNRRKGQKGFRYFQNPEIQGLRGREIGLYFKDLNKKKMKKERTINLNIPNCVLTALDKNLAAIAKTAKNHNIPLSQTINKTNSFKNNLKLDIFIKDNTTIKSEKVTEQEKESKEIKNEHDYIYQTNCKAGPSTAPDFIPIPKNYISTSEPRRLSLRGMDDFKYGYNDIITGTFDEKLDECLARGNISNAETENLSAALFEEYKDMVQHDNYKKFLQFRQILPAYIKAENIMEVIENNQVMVISGETGCGKSTQVPQIILDNALKNKKGANVKILVTQPRRIAASSLAIRVSNERAENLGNSVGYVVRLEKVDARPRASILFCTTGILLSDLEVNQGLTEYSHIILDEVHERDSNVDLSMCMLRQVLKKRKDLKLIMMSATLDAESLSAYFDNCPVMHIEGLAYPVRDVYLEDILKETRFRLTDSNRPRAPKVQPKWMKHRGQKGKNEAMQDIQYKAEISGWLESKKEHLDFDVYKTLQDSQIEELNFKLIVELLIHICKDKPGAILVFLPGIGEITKLMRLMEESKQFPPSRFEIYPLHSKLPTLEQHKIFEKPLEHIRKIIIATNIAETSITIDDIVYVVDCAKLKINGLNVEQNISTLQIQWVAQANLRQRRGRAGRCQPGVCYHLLTSFRAEKLEERLLPELQRTNLLESVLMIKRLRLGLAEDALKMVPSPPAPSTIKWAVTHLQKLGALNDNEVLTALGWHLARLPVHPAAGKLLLLGSLFGCLDRAASVAAVWGFKDPFQMVIGKENELYKAKRILALGEPSDHVTVSEAIIQWEGYSKREQRSFAYEHFLSNNTLELLSDMKRQFGDHLRQMGFLPTGDVKSSWENRNTNNFSLFKALIAASLYPNIATVRWFGRNRASRIIAHCPEDGRLQVHPSSVMSGNKGPQSKNPVALCSSPGANWLVYWLKQKSSELFILDVTLIYTLPLLFFGEFVVTEDCENPAYCLISISSIKVRCSRDYANKLFQLRCLLDQVIGSVVMINSDRSTKHSEFDELVLNSVIQLMTAEDEQVEYLEDGASDNDHDSDSD